MCRVLYNNKCRGSTTRVPGWIDNAKMTSLVIPSDKDHGYSKMVAPMGDHGDNEFVNEPYLCNFSKPLCQNFGKKEGILRKHISSVLQDDLFLLFCVR